ncbi:MAG: diphosphatase [Acidobacteriota bacterium]|nr:diphosphatase [Acidobacteriota bacterium]
MLPPNVFAGSRLDRAANLRRDPEWLARALADPESRLVPVYRGRSLVRFEGEAARAVALRVAQAAQTPWLPADPEAAPLLGIGGGIAHFALDLSRHAEEDVRRQLLEIGDEMGDLVELRTIGAVLDREEAALLAYARGLLHWHSRHGFCGVCGGATLSQSGGHVRHCPRCGADHFPRTDPAVIMLVTHGDRCLLGHQRAWPERMYSTLAGFVEPGESLEEAVAREVLEEAGIAVEAVEYHSSQPWPFPASIMLGFRAQAVTTAIDRQDEELADARWFHREELADPEKRSIQLPNPASIARRLIEDWLAEG